MQTILTHAIIETRLHDAERRLADPSRAASPGRTPSLMRRLRPHARRRPGLRPLHSHRRARPTG